jgi:transposase
MKQVVRQNVGVDIAKADFKAVFSVLTAEHAVLVRGSRTFANTSLGFARLLAWAQGKACEGLPLSFTMEATGVYYEGLAYFLHERGRAVHVVLPNQSRRYGQSLGLKSKTDLLDAQMLAQLGLERSLRAWLPLSPQLLRLKQLTREREALVQDRTGALNRLHALRHQGRPCPSSIARAERRVALLNELVREVEAELRQAVAKDGALAERLRYLESIPGVGFLTAVVVVAETNGFATFGSIKQLTSYAGLDVRVAESGSWRGRSKISKRGNRYIRKALYFPAFSKARLHAPTRQYYERLKDKKGRAMVAAVAVQRKLLGLMFTLWKKQEAFGDIRQIDASGSEERRSSFGFLPEGQNKKVVGA